MKYVKLSCYLMLACLVSCLIAGCGSTKYIERKQYLLELPKNFTKQTKPLAKCTLVIEPVAAVAPFDQCDFIYRTPSGQYLVDYYNGFFIAPAAQLDTLLRDYFRNYGNCYLDDIAITTAAPRLQVKLTALYADYRDRNNPQGIIALQFILSSPPNSKNVVLLNKTWQSSIILKKKNTESLLQAWNQGVEAIFTQALPALNQVVKQQK